jgi:hypothetical protein
MQSTMQEAPKKRSTTKRASKRGTNEARVPTHEEIAQRARELFEQSGYPADRDVEFWLEAERQLREVVQD